MTLVTWDPVNKGAGVVLSNGDLTAMIPNNTQHVRATKGKSTGKWYWEITPIGAGAIQSYIGIVSSSQSPTGGISNNFRLYRNNGSMYPSGTNGDSYVAGNRIGVALDLDNGTLEFYKNGVSQGIAFSNIKDMGEVLPSVTSGSSLTSQSFIANFGATPFIYDIPEGFRPYDWGGLCE